jgi:predicted outer membrane repeat protein
MIDINSILSEINTQCSNLCFISNQLKAYINANEEVLRNEGSSKALFQLISGSIKFINSTHVYDQDTLINAFVSSVVFQDSTISDLNLTYNSIAIVSSTLEFSNMIVVKISNPDKHGFIDISSDSYVTMQNVMYTDSDSVLFNLRFSEASIFNITMKNITQAQHLFELYEASNVEITSFTAVNSSTENESLIIVRKSENLTFNNFTLDHIENPLLTIQDSQFTKITYLNFSSSEIPITIERSTINEFTNSVFTNNGNITENKGGAINIFNSDVTLSNSTFSNNMAESGGAIYFDCTLMALCNLDVQTTVFSGNNADSKGGAIYYGYKRPQLTGVTNSNNHAPYGPDLASYAVMIKMLGSDEMIIDDVGSNIKYEKNVKFVLLDYDNQVMVLNNVNQITITPVDTSISSIGGVNSVLLKSGIATFDNLVATAKYGSKNIKYQVASKAINSVKINQVYGSTIGNNILTFNFRNCMPGESIIGDYKCQECSAGSYSFLWNSPKCFTCMDDVVCLGRDIIEVNPEFWRKTKNSTKIVE